MVIISNDPIRIDSSIEDEQRRFISKVFTWMFVGLLVTGLTGWYIAGSKAITSIIFGSSIVFYGLLIVQLVLVFKLSGMVKKMSAATATVTYLLYSVLSGFTFSAVFLIYSAESISSTFIITAAVFGGMSLYGYTTKKDLTSWGSFLFMGLFGIVIASIVNLFIGSSGASWIISLVGVAVFTGLTAYDIQKIKEINVIGNEGTDEDHVEAIYGALILYLDFINLFFDFLRLSRRY